MLDINLIKKEIEEAISDLELNLSGLTILTEGATNLFALTALLAAKVGADVYAVAEESEYGSLQKVKKETLDLAKRLKIKTDKLRILPKKDFVQFEKVNIITNLGHLRPINEKLIAKLNPTTVISYMREAWEERPGEIDFSACKARGIKVFGINEDFSQVDCFRESGLLALKMIFDAGLSPYKARIAIASRDKFGKVIYDVLKNYTRNAFIINKFPAKMLELKNLDIIIIADLLSEKEVIGTKIKERELRSLSPGVTKIIFCERFRMNQTLADISIRAFVRLQAGGLKVGELAFKKDYQNKRFAKILERMV